MGVSGQAATVDDPGAGLLALYDRALPHVYGYLLSRCGGALLAEDLTAETFLAAVDAVRRDDPPPLSTAWLVGVARHKLVDHWRRQGRESAASAPPANRKKRMTRGTSISTRSAPATRSRGLHRTIALR